MSDVAFYITAHGYGHGARTCDLLNTFHRLDPDVRIRIVTGLPEWFINSRLTFRPHQFRAASFDVGLVQQDSIQVDLPQTERNLQDLVSTWDRWVTEEAAWIKEQRIQLVVSDIPAIPLAAANTVKVPTVALGNFHWGWIYEEFVYRHPVWQTAIDLYNRAYTQCGRLLRYPFSAPMEPFQHIEDVPLVAAKGENRRIELARLTGANPEKQWVLLSFTTLDVGHEALLRMAKSGETTFFTLQPLGWNLPGFHKIDPHDIEVSDIFASVDVVLTKPGFGVLSDCSVNEKPMIFVERTEWREYLVLEAALKSSFRALHLPAEQLYAGDIQGALEAIGQVEPPRTVVSADGGQRAAELIEESICN